MSYHTNKQNKRIYRLFHEKRTPLPEKEIPTVKVTVDISKTNFFSIHIQKTQIICQLCKAKGITTSDLQQLISLSVELYQ